MKKPLLAIVVAFLAGIAGAWVFSSGFLGKSPAGGSAAVRENAFDRVMRAQTIRCAYVVWPPLTIKDLKTGKLSGIIPDYVEALGAALHLKIEWSEEIGSGDYAAALDYGRVDAICAGIWPGAARARQMDFTRPVFYQPQYAYARADDRRFDHHLEKIDDPSVTLATMDGAISSLIAANDFPKAKTLQLPQLTSASDLLLSVANGKADVAVADPDTAARFDAVNPGKILRVPAKVPMRVFGDTIAIPQEEHKLRHMMDIATEELIASGKIEKIIAKYEQFPETLLRTAPNYRTEP